ncbi:MAG: hypothetical protein ACOH1J_05635 [Microbacteriaceae bacterium]
MRIGVLMADHQADSIASSLPSLLAAAVAQLQLAGAPIEALGEMRRGRGIGSLRTASALHPVGYAWRLGVLLLTEDCRLFATGEVTRAVMPQLAVTNRSESAEHRRDIRRAAVRGRFPDGEAINYGFIPIALDAESLRAGSGPLSIDGDAVVVEWSTRLGTRPLADYLADRARLLTEDWA